MDSNRLNELKAFDATKAGVKGLIDKGVTKIPTLFHHPLDNFAMGTNSTNTKHVIPIIDFANVGNDPNIRQEIRNKIKEACETWGFFQVINHGIPMNVIEDMRNGVIRFFEQDLEVKKEFYSLDQLRSFSYNSNFNLYSSKALNWRDTFVCSLAPNAPKPQDLPLVCRKELVEYGEQVTKLGMTLFELLSEALGLHPNHLKDMGCADGILSLSHYYPPCPEPELTMGTTKHSDSCFLTLLLQDHLIGGLQVLHQNNWIDIPPVFDALVINVGDLMQLITNDKFKSVEHRVLSNIIGPRVSVACFFNADFNSLSRLYGPIKDFLCEDNQPKYKEISIADYVAYYNTKGLDGTSVLQHFKL